MGDPFTLSLFPSFASVNSIPVPVHFAEDDDLNIDTDSAGGWTQTSATSEHPMNREPRINVED
jgi:hypothetical protein